MLKLLVLCCVAAIWLQGPSVVNAECCYNRQLRVRDERTGRMMKKSVCGDCTRGTPFCSRGGCNVFGCNCDDGCRSGQCFTPDGKRRRGLRMRSEYDAHDVIRAVDVDGDGRMSLEEARRHLASAGLPANHVERSLEHLDHNQDQFLSAHEIDSDIK